MLVDYLENASQELREITERIHATDAEYRKSFDKQLRQEMQEIKKELRKKRYDIYEEISKNIQELYLIKKYFPELLDVFIQDEYLGAIIKRKVWILKFKKLTKDQVEKCIKDVKDRRKQTKEVKKFLKKWVGTIDARSMEATWPVLKGKLDIAQDKEDAMEKVDEIDRELRREGWALLLNESHINKYLKRMFVKFEKATSDTVEKKGILEKSTGKGTLVESNAMKEFKKADKTRRKMERLCKHILFSSPDVLINLKNGKTDWRSAGGSIFMNNFVKKLDFKKINEDQWLREMKKKIGQ